MTMCASIGTAWDASMSIDTSVSTSDLSGCPKSILKLFVINTLDVCS